MKTIVILALLASLSCAKEVSKESIQNNNELKVYQGKTILGHWCSTTDNSVLEFWSNVMYLYSDTLDHVYHTNILRFNWTSTGKPIWILPFGIITIWTYDVPVQLTYKFEVLTLTDSVLVIRNNKIHSYKLKWRF
jgi:hypothetical protein